jgi:hypothetical protein
LSQSAFGAIDGDADDGGVSIHPVVRNPNFELSNLIPANLQALSLFTASESM